MSPDYGGLLAADGVTVIGLLIIAVLSFVFKFVVPGSWYKEVKQERDEAIQARLDDAKEDRILSRSLIKGSDSRRE